MNDQVQVTLDEKKKTLTLVIPANLKPNPSKSGKTEIVASSQGNVPTSAKLPDGRTITIGFNAYVKPKVATE